MQVLPTIIFSSSFISILYYLGVMQWLVQKLAWLLRFSIGTSATETLVAVGLFKLMPCVLKLS